MSEWTEFDDTFPVGANWLEVERDLEFRHEAVTVSLIDKGTLGKRAPETYRLVGTALSLLYRLAACHWGCRGGDHLEEHLLRRFSNFAYASLRLATGGFYDESLGMVRGMAEIANLLQLFSIDPPSLNKWRIATAQERKSGFSPYRVPLRTEQLKNLPVVSQDTYQKLCEIGIHMTPISLYSSHDSTDRQYVGPQFTVAGLILCINQLAVTIKPMLPIVATCFAPQITVADKLNQCHDQLSRSIGHVTIDNYEDFIDDKRSDAEQNFILASLTSLEGKDEQWSRLVEQGVKRLIQSGRITSLDDINDGNRELLFQSIAQTLATTYREMALKSELEFVNRVSQEAMGEYITKLRERILDHGENVTNA